MVGKVRGHLYKIVKGVISDYRCPKTWPVMAIFIKKHGLLDFRTGTILVHYLCMKKDVNGALAFVLRLKTNSIPIKLSVDVLFALTRQGKALDAYKLVVGANDSMPTMNVYDYSSIIDGLCKEGYIDSAVALSIFARKKGIVLNVVVYNMVLNGLCRHSCLVEAFRLFDSLEKNNIIPSVITYGTLIDALVKEGYLLDARQLFDRMIVRGVKPSMHIFNSLIAGYCKICNMKESLSFLHDIRTRCLEPDEFTINAIIDGFCRQSDMVGALQFFRDDPVSKTLVLDEFTVSAIIDGFCRQGDMEGALQFFIVVKDKGSSPDLLGFVYLIKGLFSKGRMEESRSILREMLQTDSSKELINRVNIEIESEPIYHFLVCLCEQGRIGEAVVILDEIGSMFFPFKRSFASSGQEQVPRTEGEVINSGSIKPLTFMHQTGLGLNTPNSSEMEKVVESCSIPGKASELCDFDAFYSEVASLCSAGNLSEASKLTKGLMSRFYKG